MVFRNELPAMMLYGLGLPEERRNRMMITQHYETNRMLRWTNK